MEKFELKLRVSQIGGYYNQRCDRKFIYSSISDKDLNKLGLVRQGSTDHSAAMAGDKWEEIVINEHLKNGKEKLLVPDFDNLRNKYSFEQTIDILKNLNKDEKTYIYQSSIIATENFLDKYLPYRNNYKFDLSLSKSYPDLIYTEYIEKEKKFRLTVIDMKNADHVKANALIQIAVYTLMLKQIIEDYNIDNCYVNEDDAEVWNKESITYNLLRNSFMLKEAYKEVDNFFYNYLPNLCNSINSGNSGEEMMDSLPCIFSNMCAYCGNMAYCENKAKQAHSVKILPYISEKAQRLVMSLVEENELKSDSMDDVFEYLQDDSKSYNLTDGCYFWKSAKYNEDAYKQAMNSYIDGKLEAVPKKEVSSLSFPVSQNVALILSAQKDVDTGRIYAYAWSLQPGFGIKLFDDDIEPYPGAKDKSGEGIYYGSLIAQTNSDKIGEFDRIDREFVEKIYELLKKISEYKVEVKAKDGNGVEYKTPTLQIYVMDNYERNNIVDALFNMLSSLDSVAEQALMDKVMAILFWIQGEKLATDADRQPEKEVDNPITVLTSELSHLYAYSQAVTYSLIELSKYYSPDFCFDRNYDYFLEGLSNVMPGITILNIWKLYDEDKEKHQKRIESMHKHLMMRMAIEWKIISTVQKEARDGNIYLSKYPSRFEMLPPAFPDEPEISRLHFETRYEEMLSHHQIRRVRLCGIDTSIDNGEILSLKCVDKDKNQYEVLNYENYKGKEWFSCWICKDDEFSRAEMLRLNDILTAKNNYVDCVNNDGKKVPVFFASGMFDYNFIDDGNSVKMTFIAARKSGFNPENGKKYLLFPRYRDFNSPKTVAGLKKLISRKEFLNPQEAFVGVKGKTDVIFDATAERIVDKYSHPDTHSFSSSQYEAFKHIFENKLSVIVGPPAAGKSDFIARSIIALSRYYSHQHNKKLNILVSGMTHEAINNVLCKVKSKINFDSPDAKKYQADDDTRINIYKVGDSKKCPSGVLALAENMDAARFSGLPVVTDILLENEISVIGMTGWSVQKAYLTQEDAGQGSFDVIFLDEASQIRAMDAFLQLESGGTNTRYVLVGDHEQLPPIIQGKYNHTSGEKYIHGSIFEMYLSALRIDDNTYEHNVISLSDNYRMNNVLCRYAAEQIYNPDYKATIPAIANQKIKLDSQVGDELYDYILDEEYPLVYGILTGPSREQKKTEVDLVTNLVKELNAHMLNDDGTIPSSEGNFWNETEDYPGACGIISPHHEHINKLRTSIMRELGCGSKEIFIGTVDKLQGQERTAVIVSYGISDRETAVNQGEFIFSRNRFNVSLTRGKAKTIVLLSDAIARSSIDTTVLIGTDENLTNGINYVQGFEDYMKRGSDVKPDEDAVSKDFVLDGGDVVLTVYKKRLV